MEVWNDEVIRDLLIITTFAWSNCSHEQTKRFFSKIITRATSKQPQTQKDTGCKKKTLEFLYQKNDYFLLSEVHMEYTVCLLILKTLSIQGLYSVGRSWINECGALSDQTHKKEKTGHSEINLSQYQFTTTRPTLTSLGMKPYLCSDRTNNSLS
jgi:hypothetical protein